MDYLTVDTNDAVFKIVDNVLKQVIGVKATMLIYKYLESRFSLRPNEFSTKPEVLTEGLRHFLCSSASIVERKILTDLYFSCDMLDTLELTKVQDYDFASKVKFALQNVN